MSIQRQAFAAIAVCGLALGCASSQTVPVRAPVVPAREPVATTQARRPIANAPSATMSQIAISEDIRAACGISDGDAYFAFDSAQVRSQDRSTLDKLAKCFETGPLQGREMLLVGHADPRGTADYNMVLGDYRAQSVRHFLSTLGLKASRMEISSRGEMDAKGYNEATWAFDRRVDVKLASTTTG